MATKHQVIGTRLRERITDGTYPPGSKIPPIPELMAEFDVARDTVRDAVAGLANQGLATPLRGVGTVVRETTPVNVKYQPGKAAAVWADQAGESPTADQLVEAAWEEADREIHIRLRLSEGSWVIRRVRHQSKSDAVAQIVEQWLPQRVADAIKEQVHIDLADVDAEIPTDLFSMMRQAGHPPVNVSERITTRMPDPHEADVLQLPPGVPVLITHRVTKLEDETPVETATFTGAGDRMSNTFDVQL